jgi:acetyl-CoA carboxylase carboxyl transferase subunit alpha
MIKRHFLEFEKPLEEISDKIDALEIVSKDNPELRSQIDKLQLEFEDRTKKIYSNLSRWNKVLISRHPQRPHTSDYIENIFSDFDELHGDRQFGDDPSIIGGLAKIDDIPVMIIGHEKGKGTEEKVRRNFGMPQPEGYRKAKRLMKMAEQFEIPIITFVDTSGAYPGIEGEERGQSEAIASNLALMSQLNTRIIIVVTGEGGSGGALKVPIIVIITGEGGSGGALALGVGDHVSMLEHAIYSVASPEACASIVWRSSEKAEEAAEAMKLTAKDLIKLNIIDEIIEEPIGGAHRNYKTISQHVRQSLLSNIENLNKIPLNRLLERRYLRLTEVGK